MLVDLHRRCAECCVSRSVKKKSYHFDLLLGKTILIAKHKLPPNEPNKHLARRTRRAAPFSHPLLGTALGFGGVGGGGAWGFETRRGYLGSCRDLGHLRCQTEHHIRQYRTHRLNPILLIFAEDYPFEHPTPPPGRNIGGSIRSIGIVCE